MAERHDSVTIGTDLSGLSFRDRKEVMRRLHKHAGEARESRAAREAKQQEWLSGQQDRIDEAARKRAARPERERKLEARDKVAADLVREGVAESHTEAQRIVADAMRKGDRRRGR